MKNKCKFCKGTGITFTKRRYKSVSFYGLTLVNEKESCKKCFGKGRK